MRHLIPSLCLALLLAETACSAPHAVKRGDSDARQKNAATRQRAESAYDELNGYGSTATSSTKSGINTASKKVAATAAAAETYIDQDAVQGASQPVIMVSPVLSMKDGVPDMSAESPYSRTTAEAINGFLTKKNYEVKSIDGQSELSSILQMQSDIANTEDDLSYLASVALDADIYIKYAPEVTNEEVSVEVSAYETSTARLLGSQSAVVRNNGHTSMKGLKGNFSSVKVNVMTAKTLDFVIYANPIKYRDSQEVYSKIRQIFKPIAETKKINITRKLILMELN